ncbi:MAG: ABC transporter permease [Lachnospiraceae bacterium]
MLKLIKLEFKKDNFKSMVRGAVILTICLVLLMALFGVMGEIGVDEDIVFENAAMVITLADLLVRASYIIFAGVLVAKVIISEFQNGTIRNLFVYPIPRKQLLTSKLVLVFVFTFIWYIITIAVILICMVILNQFIRIVPDALSISLILKNVPSILTGALFTSGIGLISLFFGLKRKSQIATIVSSVCIASLLTQNFGDNVGNNLFSIVAIPIVLCLLGIAVAIYSFRNINKVDIN